MIGKVRPGPDATQATPNGFAATWLLVVVAMAGCLTRSGLSSRAPRLPRPLGLDGVGEGAAQGFPGRAGQTFVFRPKSESEFIPESLMKEVDLLPQMKLVEHLDGATAASFGVKTASILGQPRDELLGRAIEEFIPSLGAKRESDSRQAESAAGSLSGIADELKPFTPHYRADKSVMASV